jgi:hypothetical protein
MTELECGTTSCVFNRQGRCTARNAVISNEEGGIKCLTYEPGDGSESLNLGGAPAPASGGRLPVQSGGPSSTPMPSGGASEPPPDLSEILRLMGME